MTTEDKDREVEELAKDLQEAWQDITRQYGTNEPDWEPLYKVLGPCSEDGKSPSCWFMFMGYAPGPEGSGGIRLYKHSITRRYLAIDANGRTYRRDPDTGTYHPTPVSEALSVVFENLEQMGMTPSGEKL